MTSKVEQIAKALKDARIAKGLNQRELSELVSVPQSHISKIESRAVDLRVSSLIEITRALDLEVELVPRKHLSTIRMISRSDTAPMQSKTKDSKTVKELQRLQNMTSELIREYPAVKEIGQLQSRINDLIKLPIQRAALAEIKNVRLLLDTFVNDPDNLSAIKETLIMLQHLRNRLVHNQIENTESGKVRPLYSLDEDNDV